MREKLKLALNALALPLLLGAMVIGIQAQRNRETYTISARAGGVNLVSGNVTVRRRETTETLRATDDLRSGDMVRTGADGRVEILLNPGSYLRVAENSEIELTDNSLDNLRLRLAAGDAIIEATGTERDHPTLEILTPQTRVTIIRDGLYRIVAGRTTEVYVRRGRALVGTGATPELVRAGKRASVNGMRGNAPIAVARFDRDEKDAFDRWSKERGEELARANRRLSNRSMRSALASLSSNFWDDGFGRFNYRPAGVWVYGAGCYTFVPFYGGFQSPYGGGYYYSLYPFMARGMCCGQIYSPRPGANQPVSGGSGGGGIVTPPGGGGGGGPVMPSTPTPIERPVIREQPSERPAPIQRPIIRDQ